MASVRDHYDLHLAQFYEWMTGDFDLVYRQRREDYRRLGLRSGDKAVAVDLGCGHGLDSFALNDLGFQVYAIDFNKHLLDQLRRRDQLNEIKGIEAEFTAFRAYVQDASVIVCMGDTIAHLDSFDSLQQLFVDCYSTLVEDGKLLLSFRDYGSELLGTHRFIPVKSDQSRILTCFLEYNANTVVVTDLFHEWKDGGWVQKVSSYSKLRVTSVIVEEMLRASGFRLVHREQGRFVTLLAERIK